MLACCCSPPPALILGFLGWMVLVGVGLLSLMLAPLSGYHARGVAYVSFVPLIPISLLGLLLLGSEGIRSFTPVAMLLGSPVPAGLTLALTRRCRNDNKDPNHCENCDYELRGLTKPRCPECGTEFSSSLLKPPPDPTKDS